MLRPGDDEYKTQMCRVVLTSDVLRSESNFCRSALAFLSSASFARFTSISALRLSDMIN